MSTHDPDHPSAAELDAMREAVLDAAADLYPNDTTSPAAQRLMGAARFLGRQSLLMGVIAEITRTNDREWMAQA